MLVSQPQRLGALPAWKAWSRMLFEDPFRLIPPALGKLYTAWLQAPVFPESKREPLTMWTSSAPPSLQDK